MSLTDGMNGHWGSFLIGNIFRFSWLRRVITKMKRKIREILFPQYYDVIVKVPVEQLSVIKERSKVIDISQLNFEEKPLMSWEDMKKFYKPKN